MRDADLPTSFDLKVISVDCAFKALASSDRVAIIVVGVKGPNRFVLHVTNDHLNLDATENEIRRLHSLHSPISVALVEDAANGASVVAHLTEQIPGVIARSAQGGKMSRMMASAPSWQAHNWFLDRTASESNEFVNQITQFPLGRADDIADAMSQCEIYLQENTFEYSVAAWGWARAKEWLYGTPSKPKPQAGPARSATEVCCDRRYRQKIPGGVDVCGNCRSPWNRPPIDTDGAPCDCGNTALHIRIAGGLRCNQSGRQWNDSSTPRTAPKFNRENFPKTE
jgi:predicted phage terminase large subunit-like protein